MKILKQEQFNLPVVFHRFGGGTGLAKQLTDKGWFLSFGQALFHEKSSTVRAFIKMDLKRIFLETDDADITIEKIYTQARLLKSIDIKHLKFTLCNNFNSLLS